MRKPPVLGANLAGEMCKEAARQFGCHSSSQELRSDVCAWMRVCARHARAPRKTMPCGAKCKQFLSPSPFFKRNNKTRSCLIGNKRALKNLGSIIFCPSTCKGPSVTLGNPTADDFAQC